MDYLFSILSPSFVASIWKIYEDKIEFQLSWSNGISNIKVQELYFCLGASHFNCQICPTSKSSIFERQKERQRMYIVSFMYLERIISENSKNECKDWPILSEPVMVYCQLGNSRNICWGSAMFKTLLAAIGGNKTEKDRVSAIIGPPNKGVRRSSTQLHKTTFCNLLYEI